MNADQDVVALTVENGGGTFEAGTALHFKPDHGFSVALCDGTAAFATRADGLADVGRRVAQEWGASFFGTWLDGDRVHVDPVQYVVDEERAIALAVERHQLAIYDFGTHEVLMLDANGTIVERCRQG